MESAQGEKSTIYVLPLGNLLRGNVELIRFEESHDVGAFGGLDS